MQRGFRLKFYRYMGLRVSYYAPNGETFEAWTRFEIDPYDSGVQHLALQGYKASTGAVRTSTL